jgi:hypothetical protein
VAADLDPELGQEPLGECARRHPGGGLTRAGTLEDVPSIDAVVFEDASEVGVTGPGPRDPAPPYLTRRFGALVGHDVFPVGPVPVGDQHGNGRPERLSSPKTREPFDAIALDFHPGSAPVALHATGELLVHPLSCDWEASRQTLDDGDEGLAMGFAGSGELERHDRVLGRRSALAG